MDGNDDGRIGECFQEAVPSSVRVSSSELWMADDASDACLGCHREFHPLTRRRHHVRTCGTVCVRKREGSSLTSVICS